MNRDWRINCLLGFLLLWCWAPMLQAQTEEESPWNGVWIAEGTLFRVAVKITGDQFEVSPVESLGFEWSAQAGVIKGSQASLEVSYAGATATVLVQLESADTAVATAASCLPDYLVVCVLAKDRFARFVRAGVDRLE